MLGTRETEGKGGKMYSTRKQRHMVQSTFSRSGGKKEKTGGKKKNFGSKNREKEVKRKAFRKVVSRVGEELKRGGCLTPKKGTPKKKKKKKLV